MISYKTLFHFLFNCVYHTFEQRKKMYVKDFPSRHYKFIIHLSFRNKLLVSILVYKLNVIFASNIVFITINVLYHLSIQFNYYLIFLLTKQMSFYQQAYICLFQSLCVQSSHELIIYSVMRALVHNKNLTKEGNKPNKPNILVCVSITSQGTNKSFNLHRHYECLQKANSQHCVSIIVHLMLLNAICYLFLIFHSHFFAI